MSAQKSSLLSKHIGLPVSSSTCLRLASKCDIPLDHQVKHIGIDDWAYKKGHTYGTILVDRESGKVIDLIKSRDKEDVIAWLKKHPSIESVTRDRAECYSQSIRIALPEVFQIADRFHLVVNYSDYVNRVVQKLIPELKKVKYQNNRSQPTIRDPGIQQIVNLTYGGAGVLKETKKDLILKVKEFHKRGYPKNRIARMLGLNFRTVYKYIHNDLSQIDTLSNPRVNYSEYLEDLIAGYCQGEKLSVIYRSIKQKGFQGTQRGLTARFGAVFNEGKEANIQATYRIIKREHFPLTVSSRKLSIYLTNKNYEKILTSDEIEIFDMYRANNARLQALWDISLKFRGVFEYKSAALLEDWVELVVASPFIILKSFAKGLLKDWEAVKACVIYTDSNGVTEGNVNRLKNIKRQMYGRAGFELLRRKIVLSNTG
jgi:transposase